MDLAYFFGRNHLFGSAGRERGFEFDLDKNQFIIVGHD